MLTGFRACVGIFSPAGELTHLRSFYTRETTPFQENLSDPRGFHIGTTAKFCTDYYSGMSKLNPDEKEILLELEVQQLQNPDMAERWEWPCGTEAVATKAKIRNWTLIT